MASESIFRIDNLGGRQKHDIQIDPANIPTTDQKAALAGTNGTPGPANKFVVETDTKLPTQDQKDALAGIPSHPLSATNQVAAKSYVDSLVDGLDWQESVQHNASYRKAGPPTGVGATNAEKCLDTTNFKIHTFTGGAWDAGIALSVGERVIHKTTGTDISGNSGNHLPSNSLYQYTGTNLREIIPDKATAVNVEDENAPDGSEYVYNGTAWIAKGSSTLHNNMGAIQGGSATERHHLTQNEHDAISNATSPSASNPAQLKADRRKVPVAIKFAFLGGFAANQTDVEAYESDGVFQRVVMPSAGSIVKTVLQSTVARSAGAFTAEPTINGTKVANNALDLTLDGTTTNDARATVAPDQTNLTFVAGDKLGTMFSSDPSWANGSGDLVYTIYFVFDD